MTGWNFADVLEVVADEIPDAEALIQGARRLTWAEFNRRAGQLAAYLVGAGLGRDDKVAQCLRNSPEYLESMLGLFKASLVPVNTNYRYGADELVYLWNNADVAAVVFHGAFTDTVGEARPRVPAVRLWLWVDDGSGACPAWAVPYESAISSDAPPLVDGKRNGDDLLLLYTGGTTGLPKGVMWRQDDLFLLLGTAAGAHYPPDQDLDHVRATISGPGRRHLSAAPLMHGAGCFTCLAVLAQGGSTVLLDGQSFDAVELLDTIEREQVNTVMWVGEPFAQPVLTALDATPGRWDLSSLTAVISGGAMFSEASKARLVAHIPQLLIADTFGASEAMMVGRSLSSSRGIASTGSFAPGPDLRVLTEDGRDVVPGSGEMGLLAFSGRQPIGYYKDEEKTARTFRTIDGRRYSIAGDWATVNADGTVTLLGRGSGCVNTGGEKVFPEEVEEALKLHPGVRDAAVVGVPDERLGEAIAAAVELAVNGAVEEADLIAHVKARLARYKAPKRIVFVDSVDRLANGKIDYPSIRRLITVR